MNYVFLDFETASELDLKQVGVTKYVNHPSTHILCLGYATLHNKEVKQVAKKDGYRVQIWTPYYNTDPDFQASSFKSYKFIAWNAAFDKAIFDRFFWPTKDEDWIDAMAISCYFNYPESLDDAASYILGEKKESQRALHMLTRPKKDGSFYTHDQKPEYFNELYSYCKQDVKLLIKLVQHFSQLSFPKEEYEVWLHTMKINRRGLPVDADALIHSLKLIDRFKEDLNKQVPILTNNQVQSTTQIEAIKNWINKNSNLNLPNFQKLTVEKALKQNPSPTIRKLLEIRQQVGLSTLSKYKKFNLYMHHKPNDVNFRVHDTLFYYGAVTGRFAGRGPQPQNLKRIKFTEEEADKFFKDVHRYGYEMIDLLYDKPLEKFANYVRAIICTNKYNLFMSADFSSVEAIAVSWLVGEQDLLKAIIKGLDQYKLQASQMFNVPYEAVTSEQRQAGKLCVLGCGYAGGYRALLSIAEEYGIDLSPAQAKEWVNKFRSSRPKLTYTWQAFQRAALLALQHPNEKIKVPLYSKKPIYFLYNKKFNRLETILLSGRKLFYHKPANNFKGQFKVECRGRTTRYTGAKFFQNTIQAICRDLLVYSQLQLEKEGFPVVLTVHDEVLVEYPIAKYKQDTFEKFLKVMVRKPEWAEDFPLKADGWVGRRYRK